MGIDVYINDVVPDGGESLDIGVRHDETCVFWRALRKVLNDGNPASPNVLVEVPGRDGGTYPLLVLTATKAGQVICWLALPKDASATAPGAKLHLIDHVTLNLKNRRSHSTAYGEKGGKLPTAHDWRILKFSKNAVSLWFGFAVSRSAIETQALQHDGWLRLPKGDEERRKQEYVNFWNQLIIVNANIPTVPEGPRDSFCGFVYFVDGARVTLTDDLIPPMADSASEFLDGVETPRRFHVQSMGLAIGSVQMGMLLGHLPWPMKEDGPFLLAPGVH